MTIDRMNAKTSKPGSTGLDTADKLRRLRRLTRLARVMDTAIGIPGTRIRLGADSVLGLIPGIGDAGGVLVGLFVVHQAYQLGVPKHKLGKMLANIGVDGLVGTVPLIGDLFDMYFKSHKRNVQLILDHFELDSRDLNKR